MRFTKMHGLGNDYIYVNCFEETIKNPAETARLVSDRHFGIGADGLILIGPSEKADVKMRIFNADGSEAEMCGNGIRCVAKYVYDNNLVKPGGSFALPGQAPCPISLAIETATSVLTIGLITDDLDKVENVCVNMGRPILDPQQIGVNLTGEKVVNVPVEILGETLLMTCVSMGNPHAIFFCEDIEAIELEKIGPAIENYPLFPNRTNVHFVRVKEPDKLLIRTWERGSGITLACGTGACACCVAAVLTGKGARVSTAQLPGGSLELNWSTQDDCVYMTGPAVEVFTGSFNLPKANI